MGRESALPHLDPSTWRVLLLHILSISLMQFVVANPGFPIGGRGHQPCLVGGGGCRCPTQVLFGKSVCKNERFGSHGGGWARRGAPWIRHWIEWAQCMPLPHTFETRFLHLHTVFSHTNLETAVFGIFFYLKQVYVGYV